MKSSADWKREVEALPPPLRESVGQCGCALLDLMKQYGGDAWCYALHVVYAQLEECEERDGIIGDVAVVSKETEDGQILRSIVKLDQASTDQAKSCADRLLALAKEYGKEIAMSGCLMAFFRLAKGVESESNPSQTSSKGEET